MAHLGSQHLLGPTSHGLLSFYPTGAEQAHYSLDAPQHLGCVVPAPVCDLPQNGYLSCCLIGLISHRSHCTFAISFGVSRQALELLPPASSPQVLLGTKTCTEASSCLGKAPSTFSTFDPLVA